MSETDNRAPELQIVASTFVAVAFIAVVLRVYVRVFLVKAFGWDDGWMIIALLSHITFAAAALGGTVFGTGRHMVDLAPEDIVKAMRYWWICYIGYCLCMITAKISIGLFLLRIAIQPIHRWIIYTVMGVSVVTGAAFFFVTVFQCTPISFFWNQNQTGHCVDIDIIIVFTYLYSGVAVVCDFTFALLPFFLIWGLKMSLKTRAVLIPILGMGCIASLAVVVRLRYVQDFKNPDFLWATIDIAIWSDTECGLAVIAGSLATLRPLYRQLSKSFGFATTDAIDPSKPSALKTPALGSGPQSRKQFGLTSTLFRTGKGSVKDEDEEYGLGDVPPMRLRDDTYDEHTDPTGKCEKGFSTWDIQAGNSMDDEALIAGKITMQKRVSQLSERRQSRKL